MQFDVPDVGAVYSARLRLTQSVDTGSGTLTVGVGDESDWSEEDLTADSVPGSELVAAKHSGVVGRGQVVELVLDASIEPGPLTLILTLDKAGENDVWFASRESETPPQLLLATKRQQLLLHL